MSHEMFVMLSLTFLGKWHTMWLCYDAFLWKTVT